MCECYANVFRWFPSDTFTSVSIDLHSKIISEFSPHIYAAVQDQMGVYIYMLILRVSRYIILALSNRIYINACNI